MLRYGFCIKCKEVRTLLQHFISTIFCENSLRPDNKRVSPALICPQIFIFEQMRLSLTARQSSRMTMTVNNWRWIVHFTTDLSGLSRHNNQKLAGGFYAKYHHWHSHYTATLTPRSPGQTSVINNKSMIHFQKFSDWMRIWLIIPARACWLAFLGEINFILSTVGWDAIAAVGRVWVDINFPKTFKIFITQSISG